MGLWFGVSCRQLLWCIVRFKPVLPFEFTLPGRPVSFQTKDKSKLRAWMAMVQKVASKMWESDRPHNDYVRLKLTYYFDAPSGNEDSVPDSDNIIKPVRAALSGVIFAHDYLLTDVVSRRKNLNGSFRVRGMSPILAEGFIQGIEFVHVKIEAAPDPADLSW
ncbi:MAG: RusA family crossover junction endodeoxyribonuclease [Cyanobacteria bacterium P01_C01_bin.120]